MKKLMKYKNYCGSIEYSVADKIFFGKVEGIKSLISFEGANMQALESDFEEAVDSYLELCNETGIEPEKPCKESISGI